jgi:mannose-1-phosphate guanylyltransferase
MSFTEKPWGSYAVLYEHDANVKVKKLYVLPGKSLSMQRHACRAEHWFVAQGIATVYTRINDKNVLLGKFNEHELLSISLGDWHQLVNEEEVGVLKIVEIQYGTHCIEEDIERVFS